MTPQEAVTKFVELRVLAAGDDYIRSAVLDVLRAIQATAKAEAKETERRRCAARANKTISAAHDETLGRLVADDLLATGELKVEIEDAKMKGRSE